MPIPEPKNDAQEWDRLKILARRINYGEMRVILQAGKPIRVETAIKQIKLDSPDDFTQGLETIPI